MAELQLSAFSLSECMEALGILLIRESFGLAFADIFRLSLWWLVWGKSGELSLA